MTIYYLPKAPWRQKVQHFEKVVERLLLLQSQLLTIYQNPQTLVDKLHDCIHGQVFEHQIITNNTGDPHYLIDKIKFALQSASKRPSNNGTTLGTSILGPNHTALLVETPEKAPKDFNLEADYDFEAELTIAEDDPNTLLYVLRRYQRRHHNTLISIRRFRRRPVRRPSIDHPCNIFGSSDHCARHHFGHNPHTKYSISHLRP